MKRILVVDDEESIRLLLRRVLESNPALAVTLADGGDEAEVCRAAPLAHEYHPDPAEAALLAPRHQRFRALYPALRDQFTPPPRS